MNTMEAFSKAKNARAKGNNYKKYNYAGAIELINCQQPKKASLGISEDLGYTEAVVFEDGKFVVDLTTEAAIAGIKGSIWGTPVLIMDGKEADCWIEEE